MPQIIPVVVDYLYRFLRCFTQDRAGFGGHHKQRRGFRGNPEDILLAGLSQLESAGGLRQFAVSDDHQSLRQQFDHPQIFCAGGQFARFGKKKIPQQYRFFHTPDFIHGRPAPADKGIVDRIIVHQSGQVHHFHCLCHRHQPFQIIIVKTGRQKQQGRTQSLAAALERMRQQIIQPRRVLHTGRFQSLFDNKQVFLDWRVDFS